MRHVRPMVVAVLLTALPLCASAKIYDFTSSESSALGNPTFSFVLNTVDAVAAGGGTSFPGVTIDKNGAEIPGNVITLISPFELASPFFFFVDTDVPGPKAFGEGAGPGMIFNVGSFSIADGFTDGEGTLIISEASSSAAPEPATWLMLLTGFAAIGIRLRQYGLRRLSAIS